MKFNIAVCEDNRGDAEYVSALVNEWADNTGSAVNIEIFPSAEAFLFRYGENKSFDILLLDIEMGETDGVELAKIIRAENEIIQIIFVTGYSSYISEGYEVSALHYLMKPVRREKLFSVLSRASDKLEKSEKTITINSCGETVIIPVYRIRYADVRLNYTTIHAREEYTVKMTLTELFSRLDERFFRVGRSAIVNLGYISRVTRTEIILQDGAAIPLPRGAYEKINRAIIDMR